MEIKVIVNNKHYIIWCDNNIEYENKLAALMNQDDISFDEDENETEDITEV